MRVFCQWAQKRDHPKNNEGLAPNVLDGILQHFFAEINQKGAKDYEPISLAAIQSSIGRYLRVSDYEYSISNSRLFEGSRDVLEGSRDVLAYYVKKGLGKKNK